MTDAEIEEQCGVSLIIDEAVSVWEYFADGLDAREDCFRKMLVARLIDKGWFGGDEKLNEALNEQYERLNLGSMDHAERERVLKIAVEASR